MSCQLNLQNNIISIERISALPSVTLQRMTLVQHVDDDDDIKVYQFNSRRVCVCLCVCPRAVSVFGWLQTHQPQLNVTSTHSCVSITRLSVCLSVCLSERQVTSHLWHWQGKDFLECASHRRTWQWRRRRQQLEVGIWTDSHTALVHSPDAPSTDRPLSPPEH